MPSIIEAHWGTIVARRGWVLAVTAAAIAALLSVDGATALAATPKAGTLVITISAPEGVPGSVAVGRRGASSTQGAEVTVSKSPAVQKNTTTVSLPVGKYRLVADAFQWDGARYTARANGRNLTVRPGKTQRISVNYVHDRGARDLRVAELSSGRISLAWSGVPRGKYVLRRATGEVPPRRRTDGRSVRVQGTSAVDRRITTGKVYSYSLFTRRSNGKWVGPLTISGSVAATGAASASYIAAASTLLAKAADLESMTVTADGLTVTFARGVVVPKIGAAVVLPITEQLDAGYLGVVQSVSSDGRSVHLVPDGLAAAFDYYEVDVPDIAAAVAGQASAPGAAVQSPGESKSAAAPSAQAKAMLVSPMAKAAFSALGGAAGVLTAADPPSKTCGKANAPDADFADFQPSIAPSGHFSMKVNKWGPIPKSAEMDLSAKLTATGALTAKVAAAYKCSLDLPRDMRVVVASPIPIALKWEFTAQVTVGAALEMSNFGVKATAGVEAKAKVSPAGFDVTGGPVATAVPLIPNIKAGSGEIGVKLGGAITFGPGAGTKVSGVIGGVRGELNLLDVKGSFYPPVGQALCVGVSAGASFDVLLTARAWIGKWNAIADYPLFTGFKDFPGFPLDYPDGCKFAPPPVPTDVLGPGVTKQSESVTGVPGQQGYAEGLIPGEKTWVLSTGLLSEAVGSPGFFASTDLQSPGDDDLSSKAGYPTFDAAAYEVVVVPTGPNLHVKYLFASEEYPEWVGSPFNDVMAVYVNGQNCAFVPGTSSPVAVNTINAGANSGFYVDNSTGAAGYNTSYDGLTLPLVCTVPVTPGQPVQIKIAVADGSDPVYDSAVALVQQGIWSD